MCQTNTSMQERLHNIDTWQRIWHFHDLGVFHKLWTLRMWWVASLRSSGQQQLVHHLDWYLWTLLPLLPFLSYLPFSNINCKKITQVSDTRPFRHLISNAIILKFTNWHFNCSAKLQVGVFVTECCHEVTKAHCLWHQWYTWRVCWVTVIERLWVHVYWASWAYLGVSGFKPPNKSVHVKMA